MEIIFHSHANKTHFHKKSCALGLILKVRVFGTRKWPIQFWEVFFKSEKRSFKRGINHEQLYKNNLGNRNRPCLLVVKLSLLKVFTIQLR